MISNAGHLASISAYACPQPCSLHVFPIKFRLFPISGKIVDHVADRVDRPLTEANGVLENAFQNPQRNGQSHPEPFDQLFHDRLGYLGSILVGPNRQTDDRIATYQGRFDDSILPTDVVELADRFQDGGDESLQGQTDFVQGGFVVPGERRNATSLQHLIEVLAQFAAFRYEFLARWPTAISVEGS